MNKSAIEKFAKFARRTLMEQVAQRAAYFGVTAKKIYPVESETSDGLLIHGRVHNREIREQRKALVREVEAILQTHPAVLESGVAGVPDEEGLTKPWAFVVLKNGAAPPEDLAAQLKELVKTRGAPHKYPRKVIFVDELPKTATGKIQRFRLREMAEEMMETAKAAQAGQ
jgi:acyl-coenzyme A synthetase/AMP-(fatty) acid ligase